MKIKKLHFIVYNLTITFIFFILSEVCIEVLMNNPKYIPSILLPSMKKYYVEYDINTIQFNDEYAQYDSNLYYKLRQGNFIFSNREFDTNFKVNKLGVRDDEKSLDKPEIIILGDSYAMGWGVEQDMTFANLLEKKSRYKVLNSGISSYGTAREMQLLNEINTDNLQFLIIQYCSNDYWENEAFYNNKNAINISSQKSYLTRCENHKKKRSYYPFKHIIKFCGIIGNRIRTKLYNKEENIIQSIKPRINEFSAFLNALTYSIDRIPNDTKIVIFSIDGKGRFVKGVRDKLDEENYSRYKKRFILLDLSSDISNSDYFILDDHINSSGHQVISNILANFIKQK